MADKGIDISTVMRGARWVTDGVGTGALRLRSAGKLRAKQVAEAGAGFARRARPEATILGGALVNNGLRAAMGLPLDKASMAAAAGAAVQAAFGSDHPEPSTAADASSPRTNPEPARPVEQSKPTIDAEFVVITQE